MKTLPLIIFTLTVVLQGSCTIAKTLRTKDGIIDMLETESETEETYLKNTSVLKLQGSIDNKRSLLSLWNYGEPQTVKGANVSHLKLAKQYIKTEQWDKAMLEINDGLALQPKNPELLRIAAITSTMLKDFYMADHYYERYMEIDPDNVKYMVGWAGVLVRTFKLQKSKKLLDKAEEISPNYLPADFYQLILKVMQTDKPLNNANWKALFLSDKQTVINWIRADRDIYKGFLGPQGFNRICNLTIGEGAARNLDEIANKISEFRENENSSTLDELENLGVEGLAIPMERAILQFDKGEIEEAVAKTEKLVSKYPQEPYLLFNYGYMLNKAGRYNDARAILRQSLDKQEGDATKFALANALVMAGEKREAWQLLQQIARSSPKKLGEWLSGNSKPLKRIRSDRRYPVLCNMIGIPPESQ